MPNEIVYRDPRGTTGLTVYVQRFTATWTVWNGAGHVAFVAANWASYKIPLTDQGGGFYAANMPAAPAGLYYFVAYQQNGGVPAATDPTLNAEPSAMHWDGTAEIPLSAIPGNVWANGSRTLSSFGFSVALSPAGLDQVVIEPAVAGGQQVNARQALAAIGSAVAGQLTGEGTTTIAIAAMGNPTVNRITATISPQGRQPTLTL